MNQENFHALLTLGVKRGASDIHLEVGYPPTYRIHGNLYSAKVEALKAEDTAAAAKWVMGDKAIGAESDELDLGYSLSGVSRFRANVFRQRGSYGLVLRVIPYDIPALEQLHLPKVIQRVVQARQGLVLVTGATGEGKSTTIAAMLNRMNQTDHIHIVTVEDPIEFLFPAGHAVIIQREVGRDTRSFKSALRAAMRQDPDVIMVGEIRDPDTAETCLRAAETGHLVVSTLHTLDAVRSVNRFVGLFPADEQLMARARLADALKAMVSLRLLPRADGQGLVPACEVMMTTLSIQQALRDPLRTQELPSLLERGHDDLGTQTFDQHLLSLCRKGVITPETAKSFASSPAEVERALSLDRGD
jgi:twitching motility protein PilT